MTHISMYLNLLWVSITRLNFISFLLLINVDQNALCQQNTCNTFSYEQEILKFDKNYARKQENVEETIYKSAKHKKPKSVSNGNYSIPVAVHIVHLSSDPIGVGSNVTDMDVENAIEYLNTKYLGMAIDPINNQNEPIEISFCLASITRDASNEFSDLDRSTEDNSGNQSASIKEHFGNANTFSRTDYLT